MTRPPCRQCGAPASRWWPYCTSCDALFGFPIVAWIILIFLGIGVYAMFVLDPARVGG